MKELLAQNVHYDKFKQHIGTQILHHTEESDVQSVDRDKNTRIQGREIKNEVAAPSAATPLPMVSANLLTDVICVYCCF
jgi:hypothetical protein